ncbi:MAG: hypothetical protein L6Q37_10130 [Bdellovibrionaceae bacterium]|nr:hypothetical protein [Pseudobdellovibrionaceae bacterium]NUM58910.1 hypothetical protein [Pseudobdellovibrionaceae bacterium]
MINFKIQTLLVLFKKNSFRKRFSLISFLMLIAVVDLKTFEELSTVVKSKSFVGGKDESNLTYVNSLQEPFRKFVLSPNEFESSETQNE